MPYDSLNTPIAMPRGAVSLVVTSATLALVEVRGDLATEETPTAQAAIALLEAECSLEAAPTALVELDLPDAALG